MSRRKMAARFLNFIASITGFTAYLRKEDAKSMEHRNP